MMGLDDKTPQNANIGASGTEPGKSGLVVEWRSLSELKEYANNARKITERAVDYVAQSIREVGFLNPVVIEPDGTIVCGHVSARAAKKAGLTEVPCVIADDLTPEQTKAFRLADNKTASMAIWNTEKLADEMSKLAGTQFSMEGMGFDERMLGADGMNGGGSETGCLDAGDAPEVKNTSEELDLDGEFGDGAFEHVCPHCGLKF